MILEAAAVRSESYISVASTGRSSKFSRNCINIGLVCEQLLQLRPPREPTSPTVAEEGGIRFPKFPKKQTLDNSYSTYLNIWREAFNEICDIAAQTSKNEIFNTEIAQSDLNKLDEGTRYNVQFLSKVFNELSKRNNYLTKLLYDQGVLDENGKIQSPKKADPTDPLLKEDLLQWLTRLENGSLSLVFDETGAKASIKTRPGTLIMPIRIFNGFKSCISALED